MTCTNCRAPRAIADRICKRCRFFFEEGRVVDLRPPRASENFDLPGTELVRRAAAGLGETTRRARAVLLPWPVRALFGVVPGLGHLVTGLRARAFLWVIAIGVLFVVATATFSQLSGQVLFGFAVAAHAYSIFELTAWRESGTAVRVPAILGIQGGLMAMWWPLVRVLAKTFVAPVSVGYRANDSASDVTVGRAMTAGALAFALTVAVLFLIWASRTLLRRREA